MNITTYTENNDVLLPFGKTDILFDYIGNLILFYEKKYYYISTRGSKIFIDEIRNVKYLRMLLKDNEFIKDNYIKGIIQHSGNTLRGRISEKINKMEDEEKQEYMEKSNYMGEDDNFIERKYYWVKKIETDDLDIYDDISNFSFNILKDISFNFSDIMLSSPSSYDTIILEGNDKSNKVIASVENINEFCTNRIIIYTDSCLKLNNIKGNYLYKLCVNDENSLYLIKI